MLTEASGGLYSILLFYKGPTSNSKEDVQGLIHLNFQYLAEWRFPTPSGPLVPHQTILLWEIIFLLSGPVSVSRFSDFSRVPQKAVLPAFLLSLRIAGGIIWNLQSWSYHLTTLTLRLSLYLQRFFFLKKRMPNNTFLVPSSLQFESRVLNLFQAALTVGK